MASDLFMLSRLSTGEGPFRGNNGRSFRLVSDGSHCFKFIVLQVATSNLWFQTISWLLAVSEPSMELRRDTIYVSRLVL